MKSIGSIFITCVSLILLCFSCSKKRHTVTRSFYYWKNYAEFSASDTTLLSGMGVQKMYIRLFDVDWSYAQRPVPRDVVNIWLNTISHMKHMELVPVVYITNRTLQNCDFKTLRKLAVQVSAKVEKVGRMDYWKDNPCVMGRELQIDCDWSASTREKYFYLLNCLRSSSPGVKLSCTIRLHQVKYMEKTGVPPVDRGMLMVYNTGSPTASREMNSIFDSNEARKYLDLQLKYPLPLDAALPLFSWGKWYRGEKFMGLLHDMNSQKIGDMGFFSHQQGAQWRCESDTALGLFYLRKGDRVVIEEVPDDKLKMAAELASSFISNDSLSVSFYHFDTNLVKHYGNAELENIYNSFH
ncbi:MAG TPA: hypothetical protein VI112_03380 [Bacteroidia bacterium]|jgi:hypothetical protein